MLYRQIKVSLPLDDGHLRQACPFCEREFKAVIPEDERNGLVQGAVEAYLTAEPELNPDDVRQGGDGEPDRHCPYCGQTASVGQWWTHQQLDYFHTIARNIIAENIGEHLLKPLRGSVAKRGGFVSISVTTNEIDVAEPWIAPEDDDMVHFPLPCCKRSLKVGEIRSPVHCFFCGFPHRSSSENTTP